MKVYFTADLHLSNENILKHEWPRKKVYGKTAREHDQRLKQLWNSIVKPEDRVYILCDLAFLSGVSERDLINSLRGRKTLIRGNHDFIKGVCCSCFDEIADIKQVYFKRSEFPQIPRDMEVTMCHYPLLEWPRSGKGTIMLHGHSHGRIDDLNAQSDKLRFDVGVDGRLAKEYGFLIELSEIYEAAHSK